MCLPLLYLSSEKEGRRERERERERGEKQITAISSGSSPREKTKQPVQDTLWPCTAWLRRVTCVREDHPGRKDKVRRKEKEREKKDAICLCHHRLVTRVRRWIRRLVWRQMATFNDQESVYSLIPANRRNSLSLLHQSHLNNWCSHEC